MQQQCPDGAAGVQLRIVAGETSRLGKVRRLVAQTLDSQRTHVVVLGYVAASLSSSELCTTVSATHAARQLRRRGSTSRRQADQVRIGYTIKLLPDKGGCMLCLYINGLEIRMTIY